MATENAVLSSKADSFERQALAYLMEQYVKLAPERPLLVGGQKSLLVELWKKERGEEVLFWEELAGQTAWVSTPDEGSRLAKIMGLIIDKTQEHAKSIDYSIKPPTFNLLYPPLK